MQSMKYHQQSAYANKYKAEYVIWKNAFATEQAEAFYDT